MMGTPLGEQTAKMEVDVVSDSNLNRLWTLTTTLSDSAFEVEAISMSSTLVVDIDCSNNEDWV